MTERYELEDSSGTLLLENGTDNYRQDFPIFVVNENVDVSESSNKLIIIIKNIVDNIDLTEAVNKFKGFVKNISDTIINPEESNNRKIREFAYTLEDTNNDAYLLEDGTGIYLHDYPLRVASSTVGITHTSQKVRGIIQQLASTVGITEASQKVKGFIKNVTQKIVNLESTINKKVRSENIYAIEASTGNYLLEDGLGFYLIDNLLIVKNATQSTVGIVAGLTQINGTVHNFAETVGLIEAFNRLRDLVRIFNETPGIVEGIVRVRDIVRNVLTNVQVLNPTEAVNRAMVMFRNTTQEIIGITEVSQRLRSIVRIISDTIGLTDLLNIVTGIVKEALATVGLSEVANRIRDVFISHNIGIFTSTDAVNIDTFTATDSVNLNDMTAIDSYNSGDFIIIDDD